MRKTALLIVLTLLLMSTISACAPQKESAGTGKLTVRDAWARPVQAGANSAIYFVIDNGGDADTMLEVRCEAAMMAEMHKTTTGADNKSSMMHQERVPLPSGEKTAFEPGGLHVMLMQVKTDLQPGQKVPCTLRFEKAGEITVEATVREP
jgi:copper(I)-binding protein